MAGEAGKLKPGPGRSAQEVATHQLGRIHAAMIELVAERGYDAITLRELTRRAGISSRSFYKHYAGKEECLLAVHRSVGSRTLRHLSESQAEASDRLGAVRLAVTRIVLDWGTAPDEAHLLLVAPYQAGQQALDQLRQTEAIFRTCLSRSFDGEPETAGSACAAQAIFDGLVAIASSQLLASRRSELAAQASWLAEWAGGLLNPPAAKPEGFEAKRCEVGRESRMPPADGLVGGEAPSPPSNDVALFVSAVTTLLTRDPDRMPTSDEIAAAAGLPRTAFNLNFPDVETCVGAALDAKLEGADSLIARLAGDSALRNLSCGRAIATMISTRLRLWDCLAAELRDPTVEATFGPQIADLHAQASAGALWGRLRHRMSRNSVEGMENLIASVMPLTLAPAIDGGEAIAFMEEEQTYSAA